MKMKNLNKIVIIIVAITSLSCEKSEKKTESQQLNCLPTNLQNGIVAFYSFGNGSLNDFSGNSYNLTNSTTAVAGVDRSGNTNCAFQFNGANNEYLKYVNPTFLDNLPSNNLSISFWYKANNNGTGVFISRDNQQYCNSGFGVWSIDFVNNVLEFGVNNGKVYNYGVETSNWQHVVITSSSSNNQLFINGVLTTNGSGINGNNCPILNQGDLFIGRQFSGLLDDIIIYDRIISSTEVIELFNLTACCN